MACSPDAPWTFGRPSCRQQPCRREHARIVRNGYAATGRLTSEQARILRSAKPSTQRARPVVEPTFDEAFAAYKRGDYATAAKGYRVHADKGHADAQYNLGLMYMNGQGVRRDNGQALTWFLPVGPAGPRPCSGKPRLPVRDWPGCAKKR